MTSVLVVCHPRDRFWQSPYVLRAIVAHWQARGLEVGVQFGWDSRPRADLVIAHVDISVLPRAAAAFFAAYPRVINGRALDIRKRRVSANLLARDDAWDGPVIVKTDENFGGMIEREHAASGPLLARLAQRIDRRLRPLREPHFGDYPVFERLAEVPDWAWRDRRLVVERFQPERDGDDFIHRQCMFMGDVLLTQVHRSRRPVVKGDDIRREPVRHEAPPSEVLACRAALGLDYGKIDYVQPGGRTVVLDATRTQSSDWIFRHPPTIEALAGGIASFMPPPACGP